MEKFKPLEMHRIAHALGVDFWSSIMKHDKKNKTINTEFYRNYYQCDQDDILDTLVKNGFATKENRLGLPVYFISDSGKEKFKSEFSAIANYQKPINRDLDYLKHRIDMYCIYIGYYTFRHDHIFIEWENFKKGIYVSHTTKDTINKFKSELSKLGAVLSTNNLKTE